MVAINDYGVNLDDAKQLCAVMQSLVIASGMCNPNQSVEERRTLGAIFMSLLFANIGAPPPSDPKFMRIQRDIAVLLDELVPGLGLVRSLRHDGEEQVRGTYGEPLKD